MNNRPMTLGARMTITIDVKIEPLPMEAASEETPKSKVTPQPEPRIIDAVPASGKGRKIDPILPKNSPRRKTKKRVSG